ncbi:MAG: M28 family peptidase [Candidatus Thorarchaeota archaeon]|nr:M28 family peptidase [Candidatus Thorarchaeota archaeon]
MKRLWFLSALVLLLIMPLVQGTPISPIESAIQSEAPPNLYTRVYGEDYSDEVYNEVSTSSYRDFVQKISENGSRWIMDYTMAAEGDNMYARNYIIQQLEELSMGKIETEIIGNCLNVVGKLPGYLPGDNPAFAITAHYDSAQRSPGANCDGSGIAAVLELARVLSMYEWPLDIYFIAFNGLFTMSGMEGSPQVANEFNNREIDLLMLYNVDTLLVQDMGAPQDERIQFGYNLGSYHNGRYWAELARQMSNNIGQNRIVPVPSPSFYLWESSDHYAFIGSFSNIMCAFESGLAEDDSYQTPNDRWDNEEYNYNLGRETTAVIGASIALTMSRALGEPLKTYSEFTLGIGNWEQIYITVTTPTTMNITSRWFGGISSFYLFSPQGILITEREFNYSSAWEPSDVLSQPVSENGQYTLMVYNNDFRTVGYEVNITIDTDIDGNGVLDREEYWIDDELFDSDLDSDGLSDAEELFLGTDMMLVDSDDDTMPDKYEVDNGFDPRDPSDGGEDWDSDGLSNAQEYSGGLNPLSKDSDNDLIPDLWELEHGLNPLVDDANLDFDEDGISNLDEYLNDTDPQEPETMQIPTEWFTAPAVLIALIGAFVYIRRRKDPWN